MASSNQEGGSNQKGSKRCSEANLISLLGVVIPPSRSNFLEECKLRERKEEPMASRFA